MSDSPWIVDVGVENFQQAVVDRSHEVPVVIDFWAPWCGPCKTLGPLLERFASEKAGAFVLAKVDTDKNPELAQAFQIQGIPTVVAISKGRPVDGFTGALPPGELKAFLDKLAPGGGPSALEHARALEEGGDRSEAIEVLRAHLRESTDDQEARIELARMLLDDDKPVDARKLFDRVPEEARGTDAARAVQARLDLLEGAGDLAALEAAVAADPDDLAAKIGLGRALCAASRHEEGLEHLLDVVKRDRTIDDDAARKAMLEVFEALGPEDPITDEFRQRLQMVLLV
jgi:putative thioredoxin